MQHSLLLRHTSLQLQHINQSEICIQQLLLPQGRLFSSSSSSKPDSADAPQQPPPSSPAEPQQQQPAAAGKAAGSNAATVTTTAAATRPKVEEEWTEVVDEKSGQTYYWNQKTGVALVSRLPCRSVAAPTCRGCVLTWIVLHSPPSTC